MTVIKHCSIFLLINFQIFNKNFLSRWNNQPFILFVFEKKHLVVLQTCDISYPLYVIPENFSKNGFRIYFLLDETYSPLMCLFWTKLCYNHLVVIVCYLRLSICGFANCISFQNYIVSSFFLSFFLDVSSSFSLCLGI